MEEQSTAEEKQKVWNLLVDDMLFRLAGKPRKWEDWQLPPIPERRTVVLNELKKAIKTGRVRKEQSACKLAIILARHFQLLENEPLEIQELYLQVLAMLLAKNRNSKWFSDIISNPFLFDNHFFWRQIAINNFYLENDFQGHNLNWEQWLNCGPAGFESKKSINDKDRDAKWAQLNKELDLLSVMFKNHPLQPSLRKDCIAIKKRKKEIMAGELILPELGWEYRLFPLYYKTSGYLKKKGKIACKVSLTYFERPDLIRKLITELGEFQDRKFVIKLWERNFRNIYSGNTVGNCLAIGNKKLYPAITLPGVPGNIRPAGILDYLVDKGIQVVEIREVKNGEEEYLVGQCYLFIFLDKDKPVLMIDSIDFHPYYHSDRRKTLNSKIRSELFEFLKNYARATGIGKVALAKNGPILESGKKKGERHEIGNDVDISDLPVVTFEKIEKFGGYWNHHPYFLESIGGTEAFMIM